MKKIMLLAMILSLTISGCVSWIIYHKPEFTGKVVDAETKEPIEGAVVIAVYNKEIMSLGAGKLSAIINVKETLTNKDGSFRIPSYTTIIQPFSWAYETSFVVFKAGYASLEEWDYYRLETYLAEGIGEEKEIKWMHNPKLKFIAAPRLIGLPRLTTWEERRLACSISLSEISNRKWPLLKRLLNEEEVWLYQNKGSRR